MSRRFKPAQPLVATGLAVTLLQGCIVPDRTIHSSVYRGTVVDEATKLPIRKARVEVDGPPGVSATVRTSSTGEFCVGPLKCWRLALFIPALHPLLPEKCRHSDPGGAALNRLYISCAGYEPTNQSVRAYGYGWTKEVVTGPIFLRRKP